MILKRFDGESSLYVRTSFQNESMQRDMGADVLARAHFDKVSDCTFTVTCSLSFLCRRYASETGTERNGERAKAKERREKVAREARAGENEIGRASCRERV